MAEATLGGERYDAADPATRPPRRDVLIGVALAAVWPALLLLGTLGVSRIAPEMNTGTQFLYNFWFPAFFGVGLSQIPVVGLFAWVAHRTKRPGIVSGLFIGAGIVFLLNATCFVVIWTTFNL